MRIEAAHPFKWIQFHMIRQDGGKAVVIIERFAVKYSNFEDDKTFDKSQSTARVWPYHISYEDAPEEKSWWADPTWDEHTAEELLVLAEEAVWKRLEEWV